MKNEINEMTLDELKRSAASDLKKARRFHNLKLRIGAILSVTVCLFITFTLLYLIWFQKEIFEDQILLGYGVIFGLLLYIGFLEGMIALFCGALFALPGYLLLGFTYQGPFSVITSVLLIVMLIVAVKRVATDSLSALTFAISPLETPPGYMFYFYRKEGEEENALVYIPNEDTVLITDYKTEFGDYAFSYFDGDNAWYPIEVGFLAYFPPIIPLIEEGESYGFRFTTWTNWFAGLLSVRARLLAPSLREKALKIAQLEELEANLEGMREEEPIGTEATFH